jgi:transcriptional regulator with XRE-family HTH domain
MAADMVALGQLVRNRRSRGGLALIDAADQLGVSKSALSRLENGRPVNLDMVFRVLNGLGLHLLVLDKGQASDALVALRPLPHRES